MSGPVFPAPSMAALEPTACRTLIKELTRAGFHDANLERLCVMENRPLFWRAPVAFFDMDGFRGSTACAGSPLSALIQLFQERHEAPVRAVEQALSSRSILLLEESGLVERNGGSLVGRAFVLPWQGLLFVADRVDRERPDQVFIPNHNTARSAALFPFFPNGGSGIDLGTGAGALGLLLNRTGIATIGVDLNARAIELVRFNARMNDIEIPNPIVADHRFLASQRGLDFAIFHMPRVHEVSDVVAWGFKDESAGVQCVRETFALLPDALAANGMAVVKHELLRPHLSVDGFLDETRSPEGLQILYQYVDPDDEREKRLREENGGIGVVFGHSFVRTRRKDDAPRVSFSVIPFDEAAHFDPRQLWERVRKMPGWEDTLLRS